VSLVSGRDEKHQGSSLGGVPPSLASQSVPNTLFRPETAARSLFRLLSGLPIRGDVPLSTSLLRWLSFSAATIVAYVLLDRCAVYLQVWPGISAWYPPVGLGFALFIYLGYGAFVPMLLASFLAAAVNYHESPFSLDFLLISPMVPIIYFTAALALRKRLGRDLQLHSVPSVLNLLGISLGLLWRPRAAERRSWCGPVRCRLARMRTPLSTGGSETPSRCSASLH
jgi:hypothetical protein